MSGDTVITLIGNLTDDPELRFTPSGAAVANFTIASTPSSFNRQTQSWEDGETLFMRCSIWKQAAENVAESLQKGTRVIAQGYLKQRSYETREGEKRTVNELEVQEIGPSMRYATAKVTKANGNGNNGQAGYNQARQQGGQQPANDPWAQPQQPPAQQGNWGPPQQPQQAQQGGWPQQPQQPAQRPQQPANDPWATPGVQNNDEPPF